MKSIKISIIIIGRICSGKTTYSKEIAKFLNTEVKSFSAFLKHYCEMNGIQANRENLQNIGEELINTQPRVFLENVINFEKGTSEIVIFEGVRHKIILDEINNLSEKTIPIFICADGKTRFNRYINRDKKDDVKISFDQFIAIDNHPVEMEIESLKSKCILIVDSVNLPINLTIEKIKNLLYK